MQKLRNLALAAVAAIVVISAYKHRAEWLPIGTNLPNIGTPAVTLHSATPPAVSTSNGPVSYAAAVNAAAPAVVNIYTTQTIRNQDNPFGEDPFFRRFFGGEPGAAQERQGLGSGVIVSPEGYILTNNHVVASADKIVVALKDGRETKPVVIGTDPDSDLAVIKIDLPKLPVANIRVDPPVQVGDVVLAIGNPFGFSQTVTQGIISAMGRRGLGINTYEDFIQTDAAINPGNSGGALVDAYGNLVGINSAIYSRSGGNMGIGFAIPVRLAKDVMTQIITKGKVVRGWLGIEVMGSRNAEGGLSLSPSGESQVTIAAVLRGGPAQQAGLEPGDMLLTINGNKVMGEEQAVAQIAALKPGTEAKISVKRHGQVLDVLARIGERPKQEAREN